MKQSLGREQLTKTYSEYFVTEISETLGKEKE